MIEEPIDRARQSFNEITELKKRDLERSKKETERMQRKI